MNINADSRFGEFANISRNEFLLYGILYKVSLMLPNPTVLEIRIRNWSAIFKDEIFYRLP